MSPIKFRAWDEDNKSMLHIGDFLARKSLGNETSLLMNLNGDLLMAAQIEPYTYKMLWARIGYSLTLMQFTGLKDKNGVEIYEGDMVRGMCSKNADDVCDGLRQSGMMGKEVTGIVEYSDLYAQFYVTTDGITYLDFMNGITDVEVIGNKYDQID